MSINVIDNSKQVNDEMLKKIQNALWAIGATAEGHAKDNCPVDTGRLRNSITHATIDQHNSGTSPAESEDYAAHGSPDEFTVVIGTNVEYAPYIEAGSSKTSAHHMLRDACQNHTDEYKAIAEAALKA